jgi:hypothetical protein
MLEGLVALHLDQRRVTFDDDQLGAHAAVGPERHRPDPAAAVIPGRRQQRSAGAVCEQRCRLAALGVVDPRHRVRANKQHVCRAAGLDLGSADRKPGQEPHARGAHVERSGSRGAQRVRDQRGGVREQLV